jgi:hypothetical protein
MKADLEQVYAWHREIFPGDSVFCGRVAAVLDARPALCYLLELVTAVFKIRSGAGTQASRHIK